MSVVLVGVVRVVGGRQRDVPGQKLFDTVDRMIRDSGEHIRQVGFRIDSVELRSSNQAVDRCGAFTADVGSREEIILSSQGDGAQSTFGCVVIYLDGAIGRVAHQGGPAPERIVNRSGDV